MKIKIELELAPSEVDLAQELISTFRTLTEHVKVSRTASTSRPDSGSQSALTPAATTTDNVSQLGAPSVPSVAPSRPAQSPAIEQTSEYIPSRQPQATSVPTSSTLNGHANGSSLPPAFRSWITSYLQAVNAQDQAAEAKALSLILGAVPTQLTAPEDRERFQEFMTAYTEALWKTGQPDASHVVVLCRILLQLNEEAKDEAKKVLINKVMKHMMIKRAPDVSRMEFFSHATTFAALVQLQMVLVPGAVQTISQLLRKEDTSCAAVTMLGKTVELCYGQLQQHCNAEMLTQLRNTLEGINHDAFKYDKEYIMQTMGWDQLPPAPPPSPPESALAGQNESATPAAASVKSTGGLLKLQPHSALNGFSTAVKGVAVDAPRTQVISITANGLLLLHDMEGRELLRITDDGFSFNDFDFNQTTGILAITAQQTSTGTSKYVTYQAEAGSLRLLGKAGSPQQGAALSNVRFLAASDSVIAADKTSNSIELVDIKGVANAADGIVAPTTIFKTTHVMITFLVSMGTGSRAFLSADKSGFVFLWDVQKPEKLATLKPPHASSNEPNLGVITCLEVVGHLVLAGAYGQGINVWDLRHLKKSPELSCVSTIKLDSSVVTRMARGPGDRQAVVAAVESIYTMELDIDGKLIGKVAGEKQSKKFYYDVKWSMVGKPTLYAASAGGSIDIYRGS